MGSAEQIADLFEQAQFAIALTGAGVSTPSGIPDYRSPGSGMWEKLDPSKFGNIDYFRRDPEAFWEIYRARLRLLTEVEPNAAHYALARLEELGYVRGLITQNVDRLHRRAGSVALAEVHGSIEHFDCIACGKSYPLGHVQRVLANPGVIPRCECHMPLKPGGVFFGEDLPPDQLGRAISWARHADFMLVCGSSLSVWPVAGLPDLTLSNGGKIAIINAMATPYDRRASVVDHGKLEEVLPQVVEVLEERRSSS